jgi:hypothetical protein
MSYGDGYAFPGQQPVYPSRRYLTADEVRAEDVADAIVEVYEADIDAGTEALIPLYDTCGETLGHPMAELLKELDAKNLDDWLRVLLRCPVGDADVALLNFRTWAAVTFERAADSMGWTKRAEAIVDQGYADSAEIAAEGAAMAAEASRRAGL